jgi:hypothetical protein
MQGKKQVVKQSGDKETQANREKIKEKNTPNPKKGRSIPSMVANSVTRKISLWQG